MTLVLSMVNFLYTHSYLGTTWRNALESWIKTRVSIENRHNGMETEFDPDTLRLNQHTMPLWAYCNHNYCSYFILFTFIMHRCLIWTPRGPRKIPLLDLILFYAVLGLYPCFTMVDKSIEICKVISHNMKSYCFDWDMALVLISERISISLWVSEWVSALAFKYTDVMYVLLHDYWYPALPATY